MQDLWRNHSSWDDPLPDSVLQTWSQFSSELECFNDIRVPRCLQFSKITPVVDYEIHGFCDASSKAYSAVVYLRVTLESKEVKVTLIASKTRVAPLKVITLPRLELCAAYLLAELCNKIVATLPFQFSHICLWSDSKIVLSWLNMESSKLSIFVSHRVAQIQTWTAQAHWKHVRGSENPADSPSRGILPSALVHHQLWWTGPKWLHEPYNFLPVTETIELSGPDEENFKAEVKPKNLGHHAVHTSPFYENLNKFSSFSKLYRVYAFCFRFLHNTRHPTERILGVLSSLEITNSITFIVKLIQSHEFPSELKLLSQGKPLPSSSSLLSLSPFLDCDHIIRVGGRLRFANVPFETKHPMLIPRAHHVTDLIISHFHKLSLHSGTSVVLSLVRQKFWFTSGRSKTRQVLRKCIVCCKSNARVSSQLMGDLPKPRVTPSRPFQNCGIDFAGPVTTKPNMSRTRIKLKSYIALFVCFATKAVHLELVSDLTSEAFIACLNRFISRRGFPSDIYSDNATNFHGAERHLRSVVALTSSQSTQDFVTEKMIKWHFSPPLGPHFGGLWESNIKSTKHHVTKVCNAAILTFEELNTLLVQIEACLNSRPLTPLSTEPNDLESLTPGHFLTGSALLSLPEFTPTPAMTLRSRWSLVQSLKNQFWTRWKHDYLHHLQTKSKWLTPSANIAIGDLVLLKDHSLIHSQKWSMARVTEVFPGPDGLVRVVCLRTREGILKHPISQICALPKE